MFENEGQRDKFLTMARELAEAADNDLNPTLFNDLDKNPSCFIVPFNGPKDKDAFREWLGSLIVHGRITWFGLIFESWMCQATSEQEYEKIMAMPAKDRPGAKEVIFVNLGCPKVELQYIAELHRVRGKRIVGKWQLMKGEALVSGRFAHVWKDSVSVNN